MAKSKAAGKVSAQSQFSQPKKRQPFTVFLIVDDRMLRESLVGILKSDKIDVQDYMTAMEFYRDYREAKRRRSAGSPPISTMPSPPSSAVKGPYA